MIDHDRVRLGMKVKVLSFGSSKAYELRDFHHIGTVTHISPVNAFITVEYPNLNRNTRTVYHMLPEEMDEVVE